MWKMLGLLAIGLAVGGGIWYVNRDQPATRSLLVSSGDAQGVDVQKSLAALDQRVRDLTAQVRALQNSSGRPAAKADGGSPDDPAAAANWQRGRGNRSPEDMAAFREQMEKRDAERIKAAGLTPERMKDINRRAEELRVAAMQAQYEAQRTGQPARGGQDVNQALRKELGDAEYERYLKASGQPTQVQVMEVLATSAAERSGIKPGDEIVSYNGKRVFDNRDLNTLSTQNTTGGTVTVEVKRDGQTVQLAVPAGPLGITGGGGPGGRGGGGPGGGGPPGGFPGGGRPGGFGGGGGGGGRGN